MFTVLSAQGIAEKSRFAHPFTEAFTVDRPTSGKLRVATDTQVRCCIHDAEGTEEQVCRNTVGERGMVYVGSTSKATKGPSAG